MNEWSPPVPICVCLRAGSILFVFPPRLSQCERLPRDGNDEAENIEEPIRAPRASGPHFNTACGLVFLLLPYFIKQSRQQAGNDIINLQEGECPRCQDNTFNW